jgi:HTH-type transcriptional regulator / antitoxin HipB
MQFCASDCFILYIRDIGVKCGTNKSYISKVENNVKDVRISTLQRIIEFGLGGRLNLSVTL